MKKSFALVAAAIFAFSSVDIAEAQSSRRPRARILNIESLDAGGGLDGSASTGIDVQQNLCGSGTAATAEPFFDTALRMTVQNDSNADIVFRSFSYTVQNADGAGRKFNSVALAPVASGFVPSGDEPTKLIGLFLKAQNGTKVFTRTNQAIPATLGFRNVTVRLTGRTASGKAVRISARTAMSFGNFDRCGAE
jgi:hypothetical protein